MAVLVDVPDSRARLLESAEQRSSLYIVENAALEALLFDRNVVGRQFRSTCRSATDKFVEHIIDELAEWKSVAELVVLSKGLVYQIGDAYEVAMGRGLPMNLIATKRVQVRDAENVEIKIAYSRMDEGAEAILIGDTVASGATLESTIGFLLRSFPDVKAIYVMSYAGSLVGARRLFTSLRAQSVRITILFGLAAFGMADNGFDLSFLHRDTVTADVYRARADEQFDGRPVSAVGWDFGSQCMAPRKYEELCWLEAEKWGLHGHASLRLARRPENMALLALEAPLIRD